MRRQKRYAAFPDTQWTLLLEACEGSTTCRQAAIDIILGQYWMPVYSFLRFKGHSHEKAEDLTQGFFTEKVIDQDLIEKAERNRGKFRTFLLTALTRYAGNIRRKQQARKRMPAGGIVRLEDVDGWRDAVSVHSPSPEEAFHFAWTARLLDDVLAALKAHYCTCGKEHYWSVFHAAVVEPSLHDTAPPKMEDLCARFGIADAVKASNMNTTVKRFFRKMLRMRVARLVGGERQVDTEIRELMDTVLSKNGKKNAGN